MYSTLTAGTRPGSRPAQEPHRFVPEKTSDWGYRLHCRVCGQERGHALHEPARKR